MKESTDVWFCAFLLHKGFAIVEYEIVGRGKVKCKFEINSSDWHALKLEFNNSDLIKFKGLIEQIKDLSF